MRTYKPVIAAVMKIGNIAPRATFKPKLHAILSTDPVLIITLPRLPDAITFQSPPVYMAALH